MKIPFRQEMKIMTELNVLNNALDIMEYHCEMGKYSCNICEGDKFTVEQLIIVAKKLASRDYKVSVLKEKEVRGLRPENRKKIKYITVGWD